MGGWKEERMGGRIEEGDDEEHWFKKGFRKTVDKEAGGTTQIRDDIRAACTHDREQDGP